MRNVKTYSQSILNYSPDYLRDFVFTKEVLIHLHPDYLPHVYDILFESSNRDICIIEYYNPTPVEIPCRDLNGMLYKRDFADEILDRHDDLILASYGFVYHRDNIFPQDDVNWFLMEKTAKR